MTNEKDEQRKAAHGGVARTQRIAITPHSLAPSAVKATIATFKSLPGCAFEPDEDIDDQGRITGVTSNAHMVEWISSRQGYAKKVETLEAEASS